MVKLVFLGRFSELAPAALSQVELPREVATLAQLSDWLAREHPFLGRAMAATRTRLVQNQEIAHDLSRPVRDGDEIAFLPPMSGG